MGAVEGAFMSHPPGEASQLVMEGLMTILINHSLALQQHFHVEESSGFLQPLAKARS